MYDSTRQSCSVRLSKLLQELREFEGGSDEEEMDLFLMEVRDFAQSFLLRLDELLSLGYKCR